VASVMRSRSLAPPRRRRQVKEIKYRCACFTCGGDVTVSRDHPLDGLCGGTGWEADDRQGEWGWHVGKRAGPVSCQGWKPARAEAPSSPFATARPDLKGEGTPFAKGAIMESARRKGRSTCLSKQPR
jgi:hypothetical protein